MKINSDFFDQKGRIIFGIGMLTCIKWNPQFQNDKMYHYLAVSYSIGGISLFYFNITINKLILTNHYSVNSASHFIDWSPDGHYIFAGLKSGRIAKIDIYNNNIDDQFINFNNILKSATQFDFSVSPDGQHIAVFFENGFSGLWGASNGKFYAKNFREISFNTNTLKDISSDGKFCASAEKYGKIKILSCKSNKLLIDFMNYNQLNNIRSVCFSPDNKYYIFLDREGLEFYEIKSGSRIQSNRFFNNSIIKEDGKEQFYFTPDGQYITIIMANKNENNRIMSFVAPSGVISNYKYLYKMAYSYTPDGNCITYIEDNILNFYNVQSNHYKKLRLCSELIKTYHFSPDGRYIITISDNCVLEKWDILKSKKKFKCDDIKVISALFSPCGKYIALSGVDKLNNKYVLQLMDSDTGNIICNFDGEKRFSSIKFSPDSEYITTNSNDNIISLWETHTGRLIIELKGHCGKINSVNFSNNGSYIISGGDDGLLIIWDLEQILGSDWFKKHLITPLIITPILFSYDTFEYLKQTKQCTVKSSQPVARCGECGLFFPVTKNMLGKELLCPTEIRNEKCNRLVKLNDFILKDGHASKMRW